MPHTNHRGRNSPDEPGPGKKASKPKPSRSAEVPRVIEEYAKELREIIKKLRRKLDWGRLRPSEMREITRRHRYANGSSLARRAVAI